MGKFKISKDVFVGSIELKRLRRFVTDDGFIALMQGNTEKYGVAVLDRGNLYDALRVIQGSTAAKITIKAGTLIDKNLDISLESADLVDKLNITTDSTDYFIKVSYDPNQNLEVGTVDISATGLLTGTGTLFTEVLRAQPDFPSRIEFVKTGLVNIGEFDITTVTNDTTAQLTGSFTAELGVQYKVIGTFTPDIVIPAASKNIFHYNGLTFVAEATASVTAGTQFLLAKVNTDGVTMTITDMRTEFFQSKGAYEVTRKPSATNTAFGVEYVKDSNVFSAGHKVIRMGWGLRSSTWALDEKNKKITFTAGVGGKNDAITDTATGDFDGWQIYDDANGLLAEIVTSTRVASTMECIVKQIKDATLFGSQELRVVPLADTITIRFHFEVGTSRTDSNVESEHTFPVHFGYGDCHVQLPGSGITKYGVDAFHTKNNLSSPLFAHNAGGAGYFNEPNWGTDGVSIASVRNTRLAAQIVVGQTPLYGLHTTAALLARQNIFTKRQEFSRGTTQVLSGTTITFPVDGNMCQVTMDNAVLEEISDTNVTEGTIFSVLFVAGTSDFVQIKNITGATGGFAHINTGSGTVGHSIFVRNGGIVMFQLMSPQWRIVGVRGVEHWVDIPLFGLWVGTGGSHQPSYTHDSHGWVHLRGAAHSTIAQAQIIVPDLIMTLPFSSMFPVADRHFASGYLPTAAVSPNSTIRTIRINTTGQVHLMGNLINVADIGVAFPVSFDGIVLPLQT